MKKVTPSLFLLREAVTSIGVTRLRTLLAVIGIVMGVGSVILMVAVGSGSRQAVDTALAKLGTNLIMVSNTPSDFRTLRKSGFARLSLHDASMIAALPSIRDAVASTNSQSAKLTAGMYNQDVQMVGTTPDYFAIKQWKFLAGNSFDDDAVRLNRRQVVIGSSIALQAFGSPQAALDHIIRLDKIPFQVVGVLEPKGRGMDGTDMDGIAILPLGVAQRLSPFSTRSGIPLILARARSQEALIPAMQGITDYLRERQHLSPTDNDNFSVRNLASLVKTASDTSRTLSLLLGAVASISLVVGGIGIMNIMLVTVTERRREIGIRRSIGGSQHAIQVQFLLEAVLIATLGGIGGLLLGIGGAAAAAQWVGLPVKIDMWSVVVALGIAAIVGIASGVYPASRAARIDPVEALRTL